MNTGMSRAKLQGDGGRSAGDDKKVADAWKRVSEQADRAAERSYQAVRRGPGHWQIVQRDVPKR